ncbi:MAG: hypothetical protein ACOYU0_01150 [Nitrospirota bacterium]
MPATIEKRFAYLEGRIEALLRLIKSINITLQLEQRGDIQPTLEDRITHLENIVKKYFKKYRGCPFTYLPSP